MDEVKTGLLQFYVVDDIRDMAAREEYFHLRAYIVDRLTDLFAVFLRHDHVKQNEVDPFPVLQEF